MKNWSLARVFLAVMRTGTQSGAARHLRTTQPRVRRQIEALERELGHTLFRRSPSGLAPNDRARALVPIAEAMEAAAEAMARRASADVAAGGPSGTVRVSAAPFVAALVLPPMLARLRERHPGLRFEVDATSAASDLLGREADVAVRMMPPLQLDLVQRHVGQVEIGLFSHCAWVRQHGTPQKLGDVLRSGALLGPDRDPVMRRLWAEVFPGLPPDAFALRSDDEGVLWSALHAGLGIAVSQVPLAAEDPTLVRIVDSWKATLGFWVVTHPDLRSEPRVAVVFDHLADGIATYVDR